MEYLLIYLIVGFVCGFICTGIASSRGMEGGFWWGFWLGIIGIIIVAVRPNDGNNSNNSQIVRDEVERIYYCKKCKGTYSSFTQCNCPTCNDTILTPTAIMLPEWITFTKEQKDALKKEFELGKTLYSASGANQNETSSKASNLYDEVQQLKRLLDDGLITQDEFDAKKKQLLGL